MYLTAQHVRSSQGVEGINAFYYQHGQYVWYGLPPAGIPDQNPGELVRQTIVVPPPGNLVRSYVDVVAPDETWWPEIRPAFMTFLGEVQRQAFPWVGVIGRCLFRVGMDAGTAPRWRHEIANLYRAVQGVHPVQVW